MPIIIKCLINNKAMAEKMKKILITKRDEIIKIADKHGAFNIKIFGSVAREEETENSDIDLLVDYDINKISAWFPLGLIEDLEKLLNQKVDIITTQSLHYFIKDTILKEAIEL